MRQIAVRTVTLWVLEDISQAVRDYWRDENVSAFRDEAAADLDRPDGPADHQRHDRVKPHGLAKRPVKAGHAVHGGRVERGAAGHHRLLFGEDLPEFVWVLQQVDHSPAEMTGGAVVPCKDRAQHLLH